MLSYDVFLSYRHRPLDNEITQKVFNLLERYRLPETLRKKGYTGVQRAFRDTEELAVSRILTETIDQALHSANCLIVICSTDTPDSEWVDREVAVFIELGRAEQIYPLLISGDPETSFPPSLKRIPDIADRTMDIRVPGSPVRKMMSLAETELLKVIAAVAGCSESELRREHKLRRSHQNGMRAAAATMMFLIITGVSLSYMLQAREYRAIAAQREEASMRILRELTYDLPDKLTNVPGAYGRIRNILERNTEEINEILLLSRNREDAEFEAAANYEKLANAESVLGQYEEAIRSEDQAIGIFESLVRKRDDRGPSALASAYNNRGNLLSACGRYEEAGTDYEAAITLEEDAPDRDELLLARMYYNAGGNAVNLGDGNRAAELFEQSLALIADREETDEVLESTALVSYNYGILLYRSGLYEEATARLEDAFKAFSKLREHTDSLQNRANIVQTASMLAACLMDQGAYGRADYYYVEAIEAAETLAQDEENRSYRAMLAELYNNRGLGFNIQGRYDKADDFYTQATELYREIAEQSGTAADRASYALSLLNTGENAFKAGEYDRSAALFEQGLAQYEPVCRELGTYDTAQYYTWLSYYELIHARNYAAALQAGQTAVDLQPDNVLANMNRAYALLYSGRAEESRDILQAIAVQGEGQADTIRRDLEAQKQAGLESEARDALIGEFSS
ncbi:MAG: toll/interleukin-1 receptor domain-containing protein [Mogibacterium sp.]|nr:toll/interleukin-1 receptor domain-containing protein [Mogibacterium sp.]